MNSSHCNVQLTHTSQLKKVLRWIKKHPQLDNVHFSNDVRLDSTHVVALYDALLKNDSVKYLTFWIPNDLGVMRQVLAATRTFVEKSTRIKAITINNNMSDDDYWSVYEEQIDIVLQSSNLYGLYFFEQYQLEELDHRLVVHQEHLDIQHNLSLFLCDGSPLVESALADRSILMNVLSYLT